MLTLNFGKRLAHTHIALPCVHKHFHPVVVLLIAKPSSCEDVFGCRLQMMRTHSGPLGLQEHISDEPCQLHYLLMCNDLMTFGMSRQV